ncbi:capsular polysaccharide synthesis protein [Amylolactobacillus amylophilus]
MDTLPVWTMWLQGEESAPAIVKSSLRSIKKKL